MAGPVTSLELSSASPLERVERLRRLDDAALRRHAVRAANERDGDALWELVEAHLTLHGASGVATSAHTRRAYRRGILDLVALWQDENLLRPSRDAGEHYVQRLRAGDRAPLVEDDAGARRRGRRVKPGPLAPATVQLKVAAARALYDALAWAGATDADPFRDVRMGRQTTRAEDVQGARSYTDYELIEMLAAAGEPQERVIVLLGAHAGLRVSEMLRLRWDDVDADKRELLVRGGKGGKSALVALTPKLAGELAGYRRARLAQAGGDGRVLELRSQYGVFNRVRRLCERAEVTFKGVHALRHSAGTRLYRQTGDLGQVQDHLRHATLDMARRYARSDRRRLRRSLDGWE